LFFSYALDKQTDKQTDSNILSTPIDSLGDVGVDNEVTVVVYVRELLR